MAAFRLPAGGRVDRARPLAIRFNGRELRGFAGDTVAATLLANGVHHVARSFKYHRPRGILSHGSDEPSALLTINRGPGRVDPNNRASVVEAVDGLDVTSQNHWPSLDFDLAEVNNLIAPLFAAGFYYKTFKWPRGLWDRLYEPAIRRLAGLGKSPEVGDPDRYTSRYAHCDVLIVGAGPAGLAAALAASEDRSKRVMLADENLELGGTLLHDVTAEIAGTPASQWLAKTVATLSARDNVVLLPRTTAFGYYNHNFVGLSERIGDHVADRRSVARERLWQVRAARVVLATGAHERPLTFANNDRPGIMLAESVRAFINRWAVAPGRHIVVATTGASAYHAALDAAAAGLLVTIVDVRHEGDCGRELAAARAVGIKVWSGHVLNRARGRKRVSAVEIESLGQGRSVVLPCDCVAMSGGWTPAVHLFSQSRGKLSFDPDLDAFIPGRSVQQECSAGAAKGTYQLADCLSDGFTAGAQAIGAAPSPAPGASGTFTGASQSSLRDGPRSGGRAFVDFQNDVTVKDIHLAVREGFESIEHVKRYTTTGMATDQGKTSNMPALKIVSQALDRSIPDVGTTTFRPPYTPVTFGTLIGPARGALFDPLRKTPIDSWAAENGAVFENVALWRRARYFPRGGEDMHAAVARECKAVRTSAGIFDATTLGKIEVVGPDAAEFLNRLYPNSWLKLEPGRCRYGLMLREDGYVMDDGVVARLAHDRFHVTTTTGGAARVLNHMEDYLQTEWPGLDVFATTITEQWAVIAIQGPRARDVVAPLVAGIDMSPQSFPHMAVRQGTICGVHTRLFRVSFTGEAGYEINVPSEHGLAVWQALYESGKAHGLVPYGTETMHVLRAERGFIIVGQETDGTVTPDDLGLAGMISKAKPDFVGKRSLQRPDLVARGRQQLVGLLTENPAEVLDEGAQIVDSSSTPRSLGHVTSSYWSANVGSSIALALVSDGRTRHGELLSVTTPGGFTRARVTPPVFLDPEGARVNA